MSTTRKLQAGGTMPTISLAKVGGGKLEIGGAGGWQVVVVYRGKHCPICRRYLKALDTLLDEFQAAGADIVAVSADPLEKAESEMAEEGWRFPVGYDLAMEQMRTLGLYISEPRSTEETDRPFSEPGLFIINPQGLAQVIDISNAPFARPDLQGVLDGLKFVQARQSPIRGTLD